MSNSVTGSTTSSSEQSPSARLTAIFTGTLGPLIGLILLCLVLSVSTENFLSLRNFLNILDPSGVQRNAFQRRFEMTCRTRSPSEKITGGSTASEPVVDLPATSLLGEGVVRMVEDAPEVDLLLADREPVRLELGEIQHVSDEPLETVGLGRDHVERASYLLRLGDDPLAKCLHVAADRGQRRPQLVRDRHEE